MVVDKVIKHEHKWMPTHVAMLSVGYPDFIIRYGCIQQDGSDCEEECYEIDVGAEL